MQSGLGACVRLQAGHAVNVVGLLQRVSEIPVNFRSMQAGSLQDRAAGMKSLRGNTSAKALG